MSEDYKRPIVEYCDYPKDKENYVIAKIDIPGLKKKFNGNVPTNAEVQLDKDENSFIVTVSVEGVSRKWQLKVQQLIHPIFSDDTSYWKVKRKDEVCVYLHKASPLLWDREIRSNGIERRT